MEAIVFDIRRSSYVDGPGIRTTVFFKGCGLRCRWCHSPESQSAEKQILLSADKCVGCGGCRGLTVENTDFICRGGAKEICGRAYGVDELFEIIARDKVFYDLSGGGVTFSGGEALLQINALSALLKKCKKAGIRTAVDTAGHVPWASFEKILPDTDLFLFDVKCVSEKLHIAGTGVSNKIILQNLARLSEEYAGEIALRVPIVPGFNTDEEELRKIAAFLRTLRYTDLELLPYHRMGESKYAALGREPTVFELPDEELMARCEKILQAG